MITAMNQNMNEAMKHICNSVNNIAFHVSGSGKIWEFRINAENKVMECRLSKKNDDWRPVCAILSSIDCTDNGWTLLHRKSHLMWEDKVIVWDYNGEDMRKTTEIVMKRLDEKCLPWRPALAKWLASNLGTSAEVRKALVAEMLVAEMLDPDHDHATEPGDAAALRLFLGFLERGIGSSLYIPLHFEEVE